MKLSSHLKSKLEICPYVNLHQLKFYIFFILIMEGCTEVESLKEEKIIINDEANNRAYQVKVVQPNDKAFLLLTTPQDTLDRWTIDFPVTHIDKGDADGDGHTELLITVVKPTRRHPDKHLPRPFILKVRNGQFVPRWLGSTFGYPLIAYSVTQPGIIRVWMRKPPDLHYLALYKWKGFSPVFDTCIFEGADSIRADKLFWLR